MSANNLTLLKSFKHTAEILSCRFSPDGSNIASGCAEGTITIRATRGDYAIIQTLKSPDVHRNAVTCIRFKPKSTKDSSVNVLIASYASGLVKKWHATSGKCLATFPSGTENLTAIDYSPDGETLAVGGGDFIVRVLKCDDFSVVTELGPGPLRSFAVGQAAPHGHTNRVFSIKFHPTDPRIIVTAGWDKTVQIWDTQSHLPLRYVYDPFVAGDAIDIDVRRNTLLVGSYSDTNSIRVYDFTTLNPITVINAHAPFHVYACLYVRNLPGYIVAAGSNANEIRILSEERGEIIGSYSSPSAFYSVDMTADGTMLAATGADKATSLFTLEVRSFRADFSKMDSASSPSVARKTAK